jgi:HAD superfamily hydrolase (TIGR01509 family)
MGKVVIFDWGGVIMHKHPVENNDKQAIIRTIKSFNTELTDDDAWNIYINTLKDENGIYISRQDDEQSKVKWVERLCREGNFNASVEEFASRFISEHLKVGYYKDLVDYIHSLRSVCKIGLFSDLIFCCTPVLDNQVDLSQFDYVWLSYITHLRKNTEDAFKLVEKDLQVSPEEILFIDDTAVNIENAQKRGWTTCQAFGYELDKIKESVQNFLDYSLEYESDTRKIK